MSKFGRDLIKSAREAASIARGERRPARAYTAAEIDVAALRKSLKLSQAEFARQFGLSAATVRDWEQKRRQPDGPARNLLRVIEYAPETVARALAG